MNKQLEIFVKMLNEPDEYALLISGCLVGYFYVKDNLSIGTVLYIYLLQVLIIGLFVCLNYLLAPASKLDLLKKDLNKLNNVNTELNKFHYLGFTVLSVLLAAVVYIVHINVRYNDVNYNYIVPLAFPYFISTLINFIYMRFIRKNYLEYRFNSFINRTLPIHYFIIFSFFAFFQNVISFIILKIIFELYIQQKEKYVLAAEK
jgi:hypothetical protein